MSSRRRLRQLANNEKSYRIDRPTALVDELDYYSGVPEWLKNMLLAGPRLSIRPGKYLLTRLKFMHSAKFGPVKLFLCLRLVLQPATLMAEVAGILISCIMEKALPGLH